MARLLRVITKNNHKGRPKGEISVPRDPKDPRGTDIPPTGPGRGVILRDNTKKGEAITCLSIDRQEMVFNISCFNAGYIVKLELRETTGLK